MQHLIGVVMTVVLVGCASVQSAHLAAPVDERGQFLGTELTASGLRVSGAEAEELASPYFGALQLTFENESAEWVRIRDVRLHFDTEQKNAAVRVPWGTDLTSWYAATAHRNQVRELNHELFLGALALGGSVVAAASGSDAGRTLGGLATLGALSTLAATQLGNSIDAAERVPLFPEHHLLAGPFAVPPALFVKKWIALSTPGAGVPCVDSVVLSYEVEQHPRELVYLKFKARSAWQRNTCRPPSTREAEG